MPRPNAVGKVGMWRHYWWCADVQMVLLVLGYVVVEGGLGMKSSVRSGWIGQGWTRSGSVCMVEKRK